MQSGKFLPNVFHNSAKVISDSHVVGVTCDKVHATDRANGFQRRRVPWQFLQTLFMNREREVRIWLLTNQ